MKKAPGYFPQPKNSPSHHHQNIIYSWLSFNWRTLLW